jgi:hypothetical protein
MGVEPMIEIISEEDYTEPTPTVCVNCTYCTQLGQEIFLCNNEASEGYGLQVMKDDECMDFAPKEGDED